jgi:hypothetical protein
VDSDGGSYADLFPSRHADKLTVNTQKRDRPQAGVRRRLRDFDANRRSSSEEIGAPQIFLDVLAICDETIYAMQINRSKS